MSCIHFRYYWNSLTKRRRTSISFNLLFCKKKLFLAVSSYFFCTTLYIEGSFLSKSYIRAKIKPIPSLINEWWAWDKIYLFSSELKARRDFFLSFFVVWGGVAMRITYTYIFLVDILIRQASNPILLSNNLSWNTGLGLSLSPLPCARILVTYAKVLHERWINLFRICS